MKRAIPVAVERRSGKDRRQQGERRRQIDPTTCERDYSDEEIAFMKSMDQYKDAPLWTVDKIAGRVMEAFSKLTGNRSKGAKGKAARGRGAARSAKGRAKKRK